MADDDCVIADEHLFNDQAHKALAFEHVERVGRDTQPSEKRRKRFGQAEVHRPLLSLFRDRLPLDPQRLLALT